MDVRINGVRYVPETERPTDDRLLAALDVVIEESDAGDGITVREYLHTLLAKVWVETEGFDGKRPFGNSGWWHEVWDALARAGFLACEMRHGGEGEDAWTEVEISDRAAADAFVVDLIRAMCFGVRAGG